MRDVRVDILRFIGLSMIILAHVEPPSILYQLRNFDVPLMVLVSGMSFGISYAANESYLSYVLKRLRRLVAPVWLFLTFFFLSIYCINPDDQVLNAKTVLTSYGLVSGIGYVWIIRVFIMVALIAPFFYHMHREIKSNVNYFSCIALLFFMFEIFRYFTLPYINEGLFKVVSLVTHFAIPYALVFALGLRLYSLSQRGLIVLLIVNLLIFMITACYLFFVSGGIVPTQQFKYPPSYYYFSYAIFVGLGMFLISSSLANVLKNLRLIDLVRFIAKNSIWIYLWHIPLVMFISINGFSIKYVVVYLGALIVTFVQVMCVKLVIVPRCKTQSFKNNICSILTG
ncbi:acyltransferase [Pokkaliibacter plantistimulans]|uniref:Acyltransferase n=1 Tax=Proteobacteria bacterium 228 TaxID=2083153 RepID=A0A2S5KJ54_9PROT|nr:acyltransferase [Pokkaliibacter plantistimulans]PPC74854.1 acyltransferase [Pokkaliibacter plantistimulans]